MHASKQRLFLNWKIGKFFLNAIWPTDWEFQSKYWLNFRFSSILSPCAFFNCNCFKSKYESYSDFDVKQKCESQICHSCTRRSKNRTSQLKCVHFSLIAWIFFYFVYLKFALGMADFSGSLHTHFRYIRISSIIAYL